MMPSGRAGCNLCGSTQRRTLATRDRNGGPLHTVMCEHCGLVFTDPVPDQATVERFYRHEYRTHYKAVPMPKMKQVYRSGLRAKIRYQRMRNLLAGGCRVLDVGCGGGEFVYLLERLGYQAEGVEPDERWSHYACQQYGVTVHCDSVYSVQLPQEQFDVISCYHVLEHLNDPRRALQRMRQWAKPEGRVVIEVPNVESRCHAPQNKWHYAHIYNFSVSTLQALGLAAGLEVEQTTLQPATLHIRTVFRKTDRGPALLIDRHCPGRTLHRIQHHRPLAHYLSPLPYRRLAEKVGRSVREQLAVRGRKNARGILDEVYNDLLAHAAPTY